MLGFHGLGLGSSDLGVGMPLPVVLVVARTALALPAVPGSDCSNSLKGGRCISILEVASASFFQCGSAPLL